MDTRIQFRVNEETKRLAQQMAESQGRTLSDACRELTEQLAEQQRKALSHDAWLSEQVNSAFDKLDAGKSTFIEHDQAKSIMAERKAKIRSRIINP
ncbi:MAG TPA: damage-inducible protein J [Aliidiomarina sp.]|nr:damage-inducible protein J [Aliidiomarina sp.]